MWTSFLSRRHRIAAVAAFFAAAVTLVAAVLVAREGRVHVHADHNRVLAGTALGMQGFVGARLDLAHLLEAQFLRERPETTAAFSEITEPVLNLFSDFQAINWVDPNGVIRWVTPLAGNEAALNLNLNSLPDPKRVLDSARSSSELRLTPPLTLAQGPRGFVGYLAIGGDAAQNGTLNLVFRTDLLLREAFKHAPLAGYAVRVRDGDATLFESDADFGQRVVVASRPVALADRAWTVELAQFQARHRVFDLADPYVAAIGLVLAAVTWFTTITVVGNQERSDITHRRFQDFARINSDWFWETDDTLRFSYLSERFQEVTGTPPDKFIGRTRAEIGAPGASDKALKNLLATMEARKPFSNFVHHRQHPERGLVYLSISGIPVFQEGRFIGYRGIGRDVTLERRHEEELAAAAVAAERANRAKSEFLATMSHELRTPLNAIMGFSDILRQQYFGPLGNQNYEGYARDIFISGEHLLTLINDILDISAIEAGKRMVDVSDVDVTKILEDCIRVFDVQCASKDITITTTVHRLDSPIQSDARMVRQIFINLISNAIKYNNPGGRVDVDAQLQDDRFIISVADTGIGIPANRISAVTQPFSRLHDDPHLTHEGTGLGLAIVKALTAMAGGTLSIASEEGVGSTFVVTLPAVLADGEDAWHAPSTSTPSHTL